MSPAEDAQLLIAIVQRHLRSLRMSLGPSYPDEDWGFTAQQALEKLLKTWIVLSDRLPPRIHDLADLADFSEKRLELKLLELQVCVAEIQQSCDF